MKATHVTTTSTKLFAIAALALSIFPTIRASAQPAEGPVVAFDHHVHILGPQLVHDWKSLGVPFSKPDDAYTSATAVLGSPTDDGSSAKVGFAVLVPMAHLYGREGFREALGLSEKDEYSRVRAENDHVAAEASRYGSRAVALCSVDYLRPYAWDEIHRCRDELKSGGIKIHLASAGTDLRSDDHLRELSKVAAWAESERVPLLIHFDPQQSGLETEDVSRFIDEVLAPHPSLVACIAHMGGSGGYSAWTRSVFGTFVEWLAAEQTAGRHRKGIYFDISAVILEKESEGVPPTTDEEAAAFRSDLRAAGFERIVFGSDYPVFDPTSYFDLLKSRVGLDASELKAIAENRVPFVPVSR